MLRCVVNPDGERMLLTVDGGGLRGIITTRGLEKLEDIEGRPCNATFDFMGGTSTEAIVAAALAVGLPPPS